jgi:hypothetical protein
MFAPQMAPLQKFIALGVVLAIFPNLIMHSVRAVSSSTGQWICIASFISLPPVRILGRMQTQTHLLCCLTHAQFAISPGRSRRSSARAN